MRNWSQSLALSLLSLAMIATSVHADLRVPEERFVRIPVVRRDMESPYGYPKDIVARVVISPSTLKLLSESDQPPVSPPSAGKPLRDWTLVAGLALSAFLVVVVLRRRRAALRPLAITLIALGLGGLAWNSVSLADMPFGRRLRPRIPVSVRIPAGVEVAFIEFEVVETDSTRLDLFH